MKNNQLPTFRFLLSFVLMALFLAAAAGCNTAHGFGKDVEKTGEKIQDGTK